MLPISPPALSLEGRGRAARNMAVGSNVAGNVAGIVAARLVMSVLSGRLSELVVWLWAVSGSRCRVCRIGASLPEWLPEMLPILLPEMLPGLPTGESG